MAITSLARPEPADDASAAATVATPFMSVATINPLADQGPAAPTAPPNPLGDLVFAVFRRLKATLFNESPTATPEQYPGQSPTGVLAGTVGAADPDGDPLAVSLAQGPSRGTVVVTSDGGYTYIPSQGLAATGGTDTFTVSIAETNGAQHIHGFAGILNALVQVLTGGAVDLGDGSTTIKTVTVNIAPVYIGNLAPVAGSPAYEVTGTNGDTGVVTGVVHVTDPDGDDLTFALAAEFDSAVGVVAVNNETGAWAFVPAPQARFDAWNSPGNDMISFSINVSDGRSTTVVDIEAPVAEAAAFDIDTPTMSVNQPAGFDVDSDGRIALVSFVDGSVVVFDPNGPAEDPIPVGAGTFDAAFGPDGRIYVSNLNTGTVSVIDPADDNSVIPFASIPGAAGLAFDEDGRLYVTSAASSALTVLNSDGSIWRTIELGSPSVGVSIGSDGIIYTTALPNTSEAGVVSIVHPDGTIDTITYGVGLYGVAVDKGGHVYVTDYTGRLSVLHPDGDPIHQWSVGRGPAADVVVADDGRIFVTDLDGTATVLIPRPYVNDPPAVGDPAFTVNDVDTVTGIVYGVVHVEDSDELTYAVAVGVDPAIGEVFVNPDAPHWAFVPTTQARQTAWNDPDARSVTFTISVSDGVHIATIDVTAPIDAATAPEVDTPPYTVTDIDASTGTIAGKVNITDADGDGVTFALGAGIDPALGGVIVNPDGSFTLTPALLARYRAWFTHGADNVTFTVIGSDGTSEASAEVTLAIAPLHPDDDGVLDATDLGRLAAIDAVEVNQNADGSVKSIVGAFSGVNVQSSADAAEALNHVAKLLGADPGFAHPENVGVQRLVDANGAVTQQIYRLSSTINGIAVLGDDVILVADADGTVAGVFSGYRRELSAVDTTATVDRDAAFAAVRSALHEQLVVQTDQQTADAVLSILTLDADLVVVDLNPDASPTLAWQVRLTTPLPANTDPIPAGATPINLPLIGGAFYVNANGANAGEVLSSSSGMESAAVIQDAYGRTFQAEWTDDGILLIDNSRDIKTYRMTYPTWAFQFPNFVQQMDPPGDVIEYDTSSGWDEQAVLVHANMADVYDFYKDVLLRTSYDGSGADLVISIGVKENENDAAWWGPYSQFLFGTGSEQYENALDVVGHEFTHAVIMSIVGGGDWRKTLDKGEAGALNEAYADILGSLIEAVVEQKSRTDPNRWLIGEDVTFSDGDQALRDLADPSRFDDGSFGSYREKYSDLYKVDEYTNDNDWGGEHVNSTIFSFAAYKMITDDATSDVSDETWANIFYKSLYMLPSNADFVTARAAVIASAKSVGLTPLQIAAIENAFHEVGIEPTALSFSAHPITDSHNIPLGLPFGGIGTVYGGGDGNIGISPDGTLIAVPNRQQSSFQIIDTVAGTITSPIQIRVPDYVESDRDYIVVSEAEFSPDGKTLFFLGEIYDTPIPGDLRVTGAVDVDTHQLVGALTVIREGYALFSDDHSRALIYRWNGHYDDNDDWVGTSEIKVLDTATNTIVGSPIEIPASIERMVAASPDGRYMYVGIGTHLYSSVDLVIVDTLNGSVSAPISLADHGILNWALDSQRNRLYLGVVKFDQRAVWTVDLDRGTVISEIPVDFPEGIAISPDGTRGYVVTHNGRWDQWDEWSLLAFDTENNAIVGGPIPIPPMPQRMEFSADGERLYVLSYYATYAEQAYYKHGAVTAIDTTTNTVVGSPIWVGPIATDLELSHDGSQVYAVSRGVLQVIDAAGF
jgi:Zn-dependent metalloprotease/sugar lactone lactonase YvrE